MSDTVSPEGAIKCLDKGFVRLVESMGCDSAIVQAARVSYGKGTRKNSEDRSLIRYMMSHRHTSVFEQVLFKFHVKAPIFVFRQWHRHRTQSINELSGRYSEMPAEFYVPEENRIQAQSVTNKQGSGKQIHENLAKTVVSCMALDQDVSYKAYEAYLKQSVARELARINLPLSIYSEMYTTMNLHNLFHFLSLRMDSHAQHEIRMYANAMYELIKPVVPIACEAFEDYMLDGCNFSGPEMNILKDPNVCVAIAEAARNMDLSHLSKRELREFKAKLNIKGKLRKST